MTTSVVQAPVRAETAPLLQATDRCDRCGARAYVRATVNGTDLLYCGHHTAVYEGKLRAAASVFHDERDRIGS